MAHTDTCNDESSATLDDVAVTVLTYQAVHWFMG